MLLSGGQGLDQLGVLRLQLGQTLLQLRMALAKLSVLRFKLLAALFPAQEDHGCGAQRRGRKSWRSG